MKLHIIENEVKFWSMIILWFVNHWFFFIGGHDIFGHKKLTKQALKEKDKRIIKK